jgi:hypothetical protein
MEMGRLPFSTSISFFIDGKRQNRRPATKAADTVLLPVVGLAHLRVLGCPDGPRKNPFVACYPYCEWEVFGGSAVGGRFVALPEW